MQNTKLIKTRKFLGEVISTAMNKTAVARVITMKLHPKFKKKYQVSRKFYVHDEKSESKVGDKIRFVECRPLSKTKRWRLVEVVKI